jgi:hypothetical protein
MPGEGTSHFHGVMEDHNYTVNVVAKTRQIFQDLSKQGVRRNVTTNRKGADPDAPQIHCCIYFLCHGGAD